MRVINRLTPPSVETLLAQWVRRDNAGAVEVAASAGLPAVARSAVDHLSRGRPADAVGLLSAALSPGGVLSGQGGQGQGEASRGGVGRDGQALALTLRAIGHVRLGGAAEAIDDLFRAEVLGQAGGTGATWTYVRRLAALAYSELQWAELAVESQLRAVELAPGGSRRRRWELVQLAGFHFQWAIALERLGLTASSGKLAYRTQLAAGRATLERLRSIAPMSAGSPDTTAGKAPHDLPDGAGSVLDALLNGIPATEAGVDRLVASAATPGLTTGALALIRARTARVLRLLGKFDESARMAALAEHTQLRGHLAGWIVDEVQFQSFTTHLSQADPENRSGATYVASINLRVWNHEQDQIDDFRSRLEEMQQRAQIADEP